MYWNQIKKSLFTVLFLLLAVALLNSCGSQKKTADRTAQGNMDTPEFHVDRGDSALQNQQYSEARNAYQKAITLKSDYSPALSGVAVCNAYLINREGVSQDAKEEVLEQSIEKIEQAIDAADSNKKMQARAHSFAIQVYFNIQLPKEEWYEKALSHFEEASQLTPNDPAPYYFMALAESYGLNFEKAEFYLGKVLQIGKKYEVEADKELKRIQQIQRALPGSKFGKSVANVKAITRADVAALFIAELKLNKLYADQKQVNSDGFEAPQAQQKIVTQSIQNMPEATDIMGHPMESTIQEVIKLKVKGLEPSPGHKFFPDQKITRAEFAMMIQDILVKVTKDKTLATKYFGQTSPYSDVSENVWYYNATRIVVERGLMEVNNKLTGNFEPMKSVSGAESLLIVRTMKQLLKTYISD